MKKNDEGYPGNDRRYDDLTEDQIPLTESLMDCMERGKSFDKKPWGMILMDASSNNTFVPMENIHGNTSSTSLGICHQE